jgi:TonB family protein
MQTGGIKNGKLKWRHAASMVLALAGAMWSHPLTAQVLTNPQEIATSEDYPSNSWLRGDEGRATFQLALGKNGRPTACTIIESSGHAELDLATCRLMMERAKYDMSSVPASNTTPTLTRKFGWTLPVSDPRALVMGVTVRSSPMRSDDAKTKCEYSDGKWRVVSTGSPCERQIPKISVRRGGFVLKSNIFDEYIYQAEKYNNSASSFNVGILLLENSYNEGVRYLEKSSQLGNFLASNTLCRMYADKEFEKFGIKFNPNQAIEYCILGYRQSYNFASINTYNDVVKRYGNVLDREVLNRAKSIIITKKQTSYASRVKEGSEIIRSKDYPSKENSRKIGGKTIAALEISAEGRVENCLILQSTYSYALDQKVCSRFKEAAIYTPAVIDGKPAAQWVEQSVTWHPAANEKPSTESIIMRILLGVVGAAL